MRTLLSIVSLVTLVGSVASASPRYITDSSAKRAVRTAVTRAYGSGSPKIEIALLGKGRLRTYSAYAPGELCSYVSGKIDMKHGRTNARVRSMKLHAM